MATKKSGWAKFPHEAKGFDYAGQMIDVPSELKRDAATLGFGATLNLGRW